MTERDTTSLEFFDAKYQRSPDPWDFATSAYEQNRYEVTIGMLSGEHFHRAFEPGCSIGALTGRLAAHCDLVEAIDISPTAVSRARERCRDLKNVTIAPGALPADIPAGSFDLIVFSELGYYWRAEALGALAALLVDRLEPGGTFLAVHWLGTSPDHILTGDQVHEIFGAAQRLITTQSRRFPGFRADRWVRAS